MRFYLLNQLPTIILESSQCIQVIVELSISFIIYPHETNETVVYLHALCAQILRSEISSLKSSILERGKPPSLSDLRVS